LQNIAEANDAARKRKGFPTVIQNKRGKPDTNFGIQLNPEGMRLAQEQNAHAKACIALRKKSEADAEKRRLRAMPMIDAWKQGVLDDKEAKQLKAFVANTLHQKAGLKQACITMISDHFERLRIDCGYCNATKNDQFVICASGEECKSNGRGGQFHATCHSTMHMGLVVVTNQWTCFFCTHAALQH